jgi:hypothetical protein
MTRAEVSRVAAQIRPLRRRTPDGRCLPIARNRPDTAVQLSAPAITTIITTITTAIASPIPMRRLFLKDAHAKQLTGAVRRAACSPAGGRPTHRGARDRGVAAWEGIRSWRGERRDCC